MRQRLTLILLTFLFFSTSTACVPADDSPFDIGSRSELFVDRSLVHDSQGVSFTLHPGKKHSQNPLVTADQPWEGWRLEIYGTVLYDEEENIFKMWYFGGNEEHFEHWGTLYATSQDGITWNKPLVGTVKSSRFAKHNMVVQGMFLSSVYKDNAEPDPNRRYKMVCWRQKPPHGAHTMVSPDGLNWVQESEKPICRSSDVITAFYDSRTQQYVAFPKLVSTWRGHVRRTFGLSTSKDFINWTPSQGGIFRPDLRDDTGSLARIEQVRPLLDQPDDPHLMRTEFYGIGAYGHESCTIAFPWMFTINNNARYGNHEGPIEIQLATSRDLVKWERPFRTPIVELGPKGSWDEGVIVTSSSAIEVGDEVRLYYGGANYTHGTPALYKTENTGRHTRYTCSIGLVSWKRDRFVSVDAGRDQGVLTTVPVRFSGKQLQLNASAKDDGEIVVEVCDPSGRPIPGFEKSNPIQGDDLRHQVTFPGQKDVSEFAGQPVVIKFHLKNASLFSYRFHD